MLALQWSVIHMTISAPITSVPSQFSILTLILPHTSLPAISGSIAPSQTGGQVLPVFGPAVVSNTVAASTATMTISAPITSAPSQFSILTLILLHTSLPAMSGRIAPSQSGGHPMSQSGMQIPVVIPFTISTMATWQSTVATTPCLPVRRSLASAGRIPITTCNVTGTSRAELASHF